jgi:hypothetical protein
MSSRMRTRTAVLSMITGGIRGTPRGQLCYPLRYQRIGYG